jgi:uncharacterized OsmC-like protein
MSEVKKTQMNVSVHTDFENEPPEAIETWLKETEARCPVTDNIKDSTKINVVNN